MKKSSVNPRPSWNLLRRKILAVSMASMISSQAGQKDPILLLGASGRLGRMLRHYWPQPYDLIGQSRAGGGDLLQFDLLQEPPHAGTALQGKRAVVCLSGVTPAYAAKHGTALSLNVDVALAAIRAASDAGIGRIFLTSSAAIYGSGGGPFGEDDIPNPVNEYGQAKARMEREGLALAAELNLPVTILRIGNVAGADAILGNWRRGMQIDQLPDGTTPRRSYIGPQTLARVIYQLTLRDTLPTLLNIAAPGPIAMGALLDAASLEWTSRAAPADVIPVVAFDTSRLENCVDFTPQDSDPAHMVAQWTAMRPPT